MIKIGILGDIGSGKSYVAQNFGYPVFNADSEVAKLYKKDKKIFNKLKKILPKYIHTFPVEKKEISNAILAQKNNLTKIIKIVHLEIRKKMNIFLKKHNKAKTQKTYKKHKHIKSIILEFEDHSEHLFEYIMDTSRFRYTKVVNYTYISISAED